MSKHATKHFATMSTSAGTTPNAKTSIVIGMDTAYIIGQQGGQVGQGIYMCDNQISQGSTGEGTLELSTHCHIGDIISFEVMPLDPTRGDTCAITGFNVSQGNVFSGAGYPMQGATPNLWYGQATTAGTQTYQIFVQITSGGLRPTKYNLNWDPFITCA